MGVKVLMPFDDFSDWLFKGKIWYITLEKQEIDKLMKELGTDNAIAKGELEEIKERKLI